MIPVTRAVQPSLFLLLIIIASILFMYGLVLDSPVERSAGIAVTLVALLLVHPIIRRTIAREENGVFRDPAGEPMPPATGRGRAPRVRFLFRVFLLIALTLSCAAAAAFRIQTTVRPDAETTVLHSFIGTVESVRMQRYTSEMVLRPEDASGGTPGGPARTPRMAVLSPRDTTVRPGDQCAVFSQARPITLERIRESPFLRGLARRGLTHIAYAGEDSLSLVRTAPDRMRETVRSAIARSIDLHFRAETAQLLKALYFGNKNHLDKRTTEQYRKAGVMHVLAASGLHVGIVAAIPLMILAPLRLGKTGILGITIVLLAFYLYITDMPVSLVRAFMMFAAYAAQRLFDMDRGAVNTLMLTASAILIFMPHELYEPGFQLTFGATLGILLFYRTFDACLDFLPRILRAPLALTLAAQVPVFPVILYHMNEINLAGTVTNLAAVPGVTLALSASIAVQCVGLFSESVARILAIPVDVSVEATALFVRMMASLGGHFRADHRWWSLLPFYGLYISPLFVTREYRRMGALALPLAFVGAWLMLSSDAVRPTSPRVVYMEPGGALVVSDGRHAMLHGRLSGPEEARVVYEILERGRVETLQLALAGTDFRSLSGAAFLARRCVIPSCVIDSGFRFSRALSRLVTILEHDGVRPEFRTLPPPPSDRADTRRSMALFSPPVRESVMSTLSAIFKPPVPASGPVGATSDPSVPGTE